MSGKGPFGLWMGMTLSDLNGDHREVRPGKYEVSSVPRPHSAFQTYILQITPRHGLSWIKALGPTIATSVFGMQLRDAFDSMEKKLAGIYGKHKRMDFLMPGSIWSEPQDWMQSLLNRERFLTTEWSKEQQSSLSDPLASVHLIAAAEDTNNGYVAIEYSFTCMDAADAELAAAEDDAL